LALRFRRSPMAALRLAQAAYARWIAHPDDLGASMNYDHCLARLVKWFDALTVERRAEVCREAGLVVEMDSMEEIGLCRFTVADKVPLYRFDALP